MKECFQSLHPDGQFIGNLLVRAFGVLGQILLHKRCFSTTDIFSDEDSCDKLHGCGIGHLSGDCRYQNGNLPLNFIVIPRIDGNPCFYEI